METARPTDLIHLVMLYPTAGRILLYRNGILHGQFRPTGPASNLQSYLEDGSLFLIGGDQNGQRPFQGDIKLARLYDRALTELEVMALFKDGKARLSGDTGTPPINPPPAVTKAPVEQSSPGGTRPPAPLPQRTDFSMTAEAFSNEVLDSISAAQKKYDGKVVELTGKVFLLGRHPLDPMNGPPSITLGEPGHAVICTPSRRSPG